MDSIIHPISGETGYFCSEKEKNLIVAIVRDFVINQLVVTSADGRGVGDE